MPAVVLPVPFLQTAASTTTLAEGGLRGRIGCAGKAEAHVGVGHRGAWGCRAPGSNARSVCSLSPTQGFRGFNAYMCFKQAQ